MPYLVIVILDDLKVMPNILDTWQKIGVPGVSIFQSTGGYRTKTWLSQVGLGALERLFETEELRRKTLLAAIEDEALMERAVAEAERIVGGFDKPNSGILFVLPILKAKGLRQPTSKAEKEIPALDEDHTWSIHRSTPIAEVLTILELEPTIVQADTPLDEVAKAMIEHASVHIACVVQEDGRLVGLIGLRRLADDLFFHILPEEFLSEIYDLDDLMEFANKSRMRTAGDAMQPPVWVKLDDPVKRAFELMHENDLPGLPVVNDVYHVVGYINLLELLAISLDYNAPLSPHET